MYAALLALLVLLAACGARQAQINAADKDKQVTVDAGDQLVITLDGNPTTGYIWEVQDLDTSLLRQAGEPKFSSSNPDLVGSGGTQTLTFTALKAGTTTLTLIYHRPWEKGVAPIDTFSVSVTIK
jgi:inhibitor of cysteine peptidase